MSTHYPPTYSGGVVESDPAQDRDNVLIEGWIRQGPRAYREPSAVNKAILDYIWGDFFPEIRGKGVTEREIRDMIRNESDPVIKPVLMLRYLEDFRPEQRTQIEFLVEHPELE